MGAAGPLHFPGQNSVTSFVGLDTDFASPKSQMNVNKRDSEGVIHPDKKFTHNKNSSGNIKLPKTDETPFIVSQRKPIEPSINRSGRA